MGGFLSGIFAGSSPGLNSAEGTAGGIAGFGTGLGESDVTQSSDFWKDILSGDPTKIGEVLGPELSNIQKQGQQQIQTAAEFGNRSGGTNAAAQTNIDTQRANADQLISTLTGEAAGQLGQIGTTEQGLGLSAAGLQGKLAQQQLENQQNSLLGNVIGDVVGAGTDLLTGGLTGLPGIGGGGGSNVDWSQIDYPVV